MVERSCCIPVRAGIVVLMFLGTFASYVLRVNLNIAIVTMTMNSKELCSPKNASDAAPSVIDDNGNTRFCWTEAEKNSLLGSFFYGYVILQIAGGTLAEKFGTKLVLAVTMSLASILALVSPIMVKWNLTAFIMVRVAQGFFESVTYPSLPPMIKRWAPLKERYKFVTFSYMGGTFGTMTTYPLGGLILKYLDWEAMFYITGVYGLIWAAVWWFVASDEPSDNCIISKSEAKHILVNRQEGIGTLRGVTPPYLKILLNPVVWVLMICDFANSLSSYIIIIEGPNFMANIMKKDISSNGVLNALPHAAEIIFGVCLGSLAGAISQRNLLSKRGVRWLYVIIGFGIQAIMVGVMGYTTENWVLCICIMTFGYGIRATQYAGICQVPLDISPKFSGTVCGFINMAGSASGVAATLLTTAFTGEDPSNIAGWRQMFLVCSGMYIICLFLFLWFAKFEPLKFDTESDVP